MARDGALIITDSLFDFLVCTRERERERERDEEERRDGERERERERDVIVWVSI